MPFSVKNPSARMHRWLLASALTVLTAAGVVAWLSRNNTSNISRRFNWSPDYGEKSVHPFGNQALFRLLDEYFPNRSLTTISQDLELALPLFSDEPAIYFFIGHRPYYDSASTAHLLAFVEAGNTAFLCSEHIPFDLMFYLYHEECPRVPWSNYSTLPTDTLRLSVKNEALSRECAVYFAEQNRPVQYNWSYISNEYFCSLLPKTPLGYANDSLVNFARFPYGKGAFYLFTTPLALTNFHLLRPEVQRYVEGVLAYMPEGNIYWDIKYREPEEVQRLRHHGRRPPSEHPIKYILQQPPLAWAWYLTLSLAALYVLFRSKRRQRVIPIWPRKENHSFEYVDAIAKMHFLQRNYRYLCVQMMHSFLLQTRERFGIALPGNIQMQQHIPNEFLRKLSEVSGVPIGDIRVIFSNYAAILVYKPTEQSVIAFRSNIQRFWDLVEKQRLEKHRS